MKDSISVVYFIDQLLGDYAVILEMCSVSTVMASKLASQLKIDYGLFVGM